jgi:hypothetical protein
VLRVGMLSWFCRVEGLRDGVAFLH